MHNLATVFHSAVDGQIDEKFHLLLQESVQFSFEFFFLLFSGKTLVVNLLVVFLNCHTEDSLLQLLSNVWEFPRAVEFDEEFFSSGFSLLSFGAESTSL